VASIDRGRPTQATTGRCSPSQVSPVPPDAPRAAKAASPPRLTSMLSTPSTQTYVSVRAGSKPFCRAVDWVALIAIVCQVAVEAPVFKYAAVLLLLWRPASVEVHLDYTFSQWERLHDDDRAAYIARSIDMLGTMAGPESPLRRQHYSQCMMRSQLTARQLESFLREYVRARPELQGSSVQHAMNDYLQALCGRPAD